MSTLGERIREVRKDAKMTQTEFGEAIGASCQTIKYYEGEYRTPRGTALNMICEKFHVNKDWLVNGEGEKYSSPTTGPIGKSTELGEIIEMIYKGEYNEYKMRLIKLVAGLTSEQLQIVRDIAHQLANADKK